MSFLFANRFDVAQHSTPMGKWDNGNHSRK